MSVFSIFARKTLAVCSLAAVLPWAALAQGNYAASGGQYPIAGTLAGEQVHPQLSLTTNGGFLVWEDNITDGYGLGVSALRLDSGLVAGFAPFRVNATGTNDQERPVVTLLKNGGAAFAWQGGRQGFQHIYARFLSSSNTWVTGDVLVNSNTARGQLNPQIAGLANGNVAVVYSSVNQVSSNSLQDVYAQILTPAGQKSGGEIQVNQFTAFNQRGASVAALANGSFVVLWVSEQQRSGSLDVINPDYLYSPTNRSSVDVFGRIFSATGAPVTGEFLVNGSWDICGTPKVAAGTDGGFMVTWWQKNYGMQAYGWDILARPFSGTGVGGAIVPVNTYLYGDQFAPQISSLGTDYFIVWTSLAQDGSREGVYGRILRSTGAPASSEMLINTTTIGQQMHPCVASDQNGRFLTVWTSFVGGAASFDLFAQRWMNVAQPLVPMDPPYVYVPFVLNNSVYQPQLQVTWAPLSGLAVDHYEVYVDGSTSPQAATTNNFWVMTSANGLTASSTHRFQVAYVAADGRRSPLSTPASGTTWSGYSWGGIPFEWMSTYYGGSNMLLWPSPSAPVVADGPTLLQVFLSGGNPLDPNTWLRTGIVRTPQGHFLTWNPQPGAIYQVQTTLSLSSWANLGSPRFSAGNTDSMFIGGNNAAYYRVLRLR